MNNQLVAIAADMRNRLAKVEKGYVQRLLFGGLIVILERRGRHWRLAIARLNAMPSKTEAEVCARDFGVPSSVDWNWTIKPNHKTKITYKVAECNWIEDEKSPDESASGQHQQTG